MNRRQFIKTTLGAIAAFLFAPWHNDNDGLLTLPPHLVMNGYDTMTEHPKWRPEIPWE